MRIAPLAPERVDIWSGNGYECRMQPMEWIGASGQSAEGFSRNLTVWAALSAWLFAQGIKMVLDFRRSRRIDFRVLVSTGGMPSAHSAMVCALAASIGLRAGFGSALFALALAFALVVMFDAQSVRRAAGQQARLLNQIVEELFKEHHFSQTRLAELLGHTRLEVFMGLVSGILVALLLHGLAG